MKLLWTADARRDRRSLIGYVETKSLQNALELDNRVSEATTALLLFPHSGRPGRLIGTRELVIQNTPYIAVYQPRDTEIVILRLIHGAQRWPPKD